MELYTPPCVELATIDSFRPLATSASNEDFGSKDGTYDLLKPFDNFPF